MSEQEAIQAFLAGTPFAVVGASRSRNKYGNKVLRCYQQDARTVFPVNPHATEVEGLRCHPSLSLLPERVHGASIITPPDVTGRVVEDAIAAGIRHLWLQPGAESQSAIETATRAGISVIHGGACLLVVLGFREG